MLDHVTIGVTDFPKALEFYDAALSALNLTRAYGDGKHYAGYGVEDKIFFWLTLKPAPVTGVHIAFGAETRLLVDDFYKAAMAAGATDNGAPGIRESYHPSYYGAFVLDPDGHNIEAVCHKPE